MLLHIIYTKYLYIIYSINVEVGEPASQRAAQLQSNPHQSTVNSLYDEVEIKRKKKTAQSALYDDLINAQ